MNLVIALVAAAALPFLVAVAIATPILLSILNLLVIAMVFGSSLSYILESMAFRPDRYVTAQDYNHARAVVNIAEIHRKAMVSAVKKMKKSTARTELANILGVDLDKKA
jgi:hypothetical protein